MTVRAMLNLVLFYCFFSLQMKFKRRLIRRVSSAIGAALTIIPPFSLPSLCLQNRKPESKSLHLVSIEIKQRQAHFSHII